MRLVHTNQNREVFIGDEVVSFRGDRYVVVGSIEPQHEGSTGRVLVQEVLPKGTKKRAPTMTQAYYPAVFDLQWVP